MTHPIMVIVILIMVFIVATYITDRLESYRWYRRRHKGTWNKYALGRRTFWIGPWVKQPYPDGYGMRHIKSETY